MAAVAENGAVKSVDHLFNGSGDDREKSSNNNKFDHQDVRELVDLLSKLNPSAKEFVPSAKSNGRLSADAPVFVASSADYYNKLFGGAFNYIKGFGADGSPLVVVNNNQQQQQLQQHRRRRNGYTQGRRRFNERVQKAQKEDSIRRTVYVSDIDQQITEEQLAALFNTCGHVIDCRVCGDPHSVLRFAFIEFANEQGARAALSLGGTMLGFYPVRVLPSKTAILPVNPTFLPQSADEREMCSRTVYCTNIDKKVTQIEVKDFFEKECGEVSRLRLLGDHVHSTRIAFVEFVQADSALHALNLSGRPLRSLPIRVSPSKTPVRPRTPRANLQ